MAEEKGRMLTCDRCGKKYLYNNVLLCPNCNEGFGKLMLDFMDEAHLSKKNNS